jgi:hypothetical protein
MSSSGASSRSPARTAEIEQRLGARVQQLADQQVMKSVEAAKQALAVDDTSLAENLLQGVSAWQASATPGVQAEWKAAQSEIAAARKVLRFRKVLRR